MKAAETDIGATSIEAELQDQSTAIHDGIHEVGKWQQFTDWLKTGPDENLNGLSRKYAPRHANKDNGHLADKVPAENLYEPPKATSDGNSRIVDWLLNGPDSYDNGHLNRTTSGRHALQTSETLGPQLRDTSNDPRADGEPLLLYLLRIRPDSPRKGRRSVSKSTLFKSILINGRSGLPGRHADGKPTETTETETSSNNSIDATAEQTAEIQGPQLRDTNDDNAPGAVKSLLHYLPSLRRSNDSPSTESKDYHNDSIDETKKWEHGWFQRMFMKKASDSDENEGINLSNFESQKKAVDALLLNKHSVLESTRYAAYFSKVGKMQAAILAFATTYLVSKGIELDDITANYTKNQDMGEWAVISTSLLATWLGSAVGKFIGGTTGEIEDAIKGLERIEEVYGTEHWTLSDSFVEVPPTQKKASNWEEEIAHGFWPSQRA